MLFRSRPKHISRKDCLYKTGDTNKQSDQGYLGDNWQTQKWTQVSRTCL